MKFTIDETFKLLGKDNLILNEMPKKSKQSINVNGFDVYTKSLRYATFYQKGTKCACCGKEGTYFRLDQDTNGSNPGRRHFNLYAEDGTLITKDHIKPKILGGKDVVDNLQPMCEACNKAKGNKYSQRIFGIKARAHNGDTVKYFPTIDSAIFFICELKRVMSSGMRPGTMCRKVISIACDFYNQLEQYEVVNMCSYTFTQEWFTWEGESCNIPDTANQEV